MRSSLSRFATTGLPKMSDDTILGNGRGRPRNAVTRAIEVLKRQGVTAFWFKILDITCYRRLHLFRRDNYYDDYTRYTGELPLEFRLLHAGDNAHYCRLTNTADSGVLKKRLDQGEFCVAAWHCGELAAVLWESPERAFIPYLGAQVELAPQTVYGNELFVRRDLRRARVSSALASASYKIIADLGYRWEVSGVMPTNPEYGQWGTQFDNFIGWMRSVRFGPWNHHWLEFCVPIDPPPMRIART
jgi:hypothetical protein